MRLTGSLAGLTAIAIMGCGGGSSGPSLPSGNAPPPPGGITVFSGSYSPDSKTVAVGATVQWGWNTCTGDGGYGGGETCVEHNVTFDAGPPHSPSQDRGSFSRTFTAAGTYDYHCTNHPAFMIGSVRVE